MSYMTIHKQKHFLYKWTSQQNNESHT